MSHQSRFIDLCQNTVLGGCFPSSDCRDGRRVYETRSLKLCREELSGASSQSVGR